MFTAIAMELLLRGAGLDRAVVEKVIAQAEEKLCPVWAMLKASTPIATSWVIRER